MTVISGELSCHYYYRFCSQNLLSFLFGKIKEESSEPKRPKLRSDSIPKDLMSVRLLVAIVRVQGSINAAESLYRVHLQEMFAFLGSRD